MKSFSYDNYLIAREQIIEHLSLPVYYMDYINGELDLDYYVRDCCPLHDEDTPSFNYFRDTKTYHCFG